MKLLSFDTSSPRISVAVVESGAVLAECAESGNSSTRLIPSIQKALELAGLTLKDIEGFVIGEGPGSYNGLRCGFATLQGILLPQPRPVAQVNSLAAIALDPAIVTPIVGVILNARKQTFFFQKFRMDNGSPKPIEEGMHERLDQIPGIESKEISWLSYDVEGIPVAYPCAAVLAKLGAPHLAPYSPEKTILEPRYLRPPV